MVGTTCGVGGNTPVKELGICPSDGPAVGLGTALLSQPCQCEGSQAVWQNLSCEVLRDWVGTALSSVGADPALTWRLDREQLELL